MTNHPGDRHVLAAAAQSGAQTIVTMNLNDFPEESLAPHGIEAQSPDEFLQYQFDLDPGLMIQIIRNQAADTHNPPRTVGQILDTLERYAPGFVALVRDYLAPQETARFILFHHEDGGML